MIDIHRLHKPILAVSDYEVAVRSFNLIAGTSGVFSDIKISKNNAIIVNKYSYYILLMF